MATKKRKLRRDDGRPAGEVDPHQIQSKHEGEDDQVDYEVAEDIHQHQVPGQQIHAQEHAGEEDVYGDPGDDPDAEDAAGEGQDGDFDAEEDIAELLEPLSRDQLISLLRTAAAFDPRTMEEIRRAADQDPAHRKIFVHGLNWTTTAETLRSFFGQYGDIEECKIVTDRVTGKSKGYGFILFRHRRSARLSLREPQKNIDGRMTACQLASIGPVANAPAPSHQPPPSAPQHHQQVPYHTPQDVLPRKIFVGNVHADVNKERLFQFFSQYGEIEEGPLGFDRQTGKAKGFALFIYKTVEGARRALQEPNKNFDGKLLYCQKATDSQRAKAAAAAAAAAGPAGTPSSGASDMQGSMGYGVAPGGSMSFPGAMDLGFAQGLLGAALPFAQGIQANPAALAMLAAAGQNPAAFGVPPSMMASLNPALAAAAMNHQGGGQVVPQSQGPQVQGYGMGGSSGFQGVSYQAQPTQQSGASYQGAPMAHASSMRAAPGSMGGYGPH